MSTRLDASLEEIAKVREVLERSAPPGLMIEGIEEATGYPNYIIWSAIHALQRKGTVKGVNPFAYDPNAVDSDPESK